MSKITTSLDAHLQHLMEITHPKSRVEVNQQNLMKSVFFLNVQRVLSWSDSLFVAFNWGRWPATLWAHAKHFHINTMFSFSLFLDSFMSSFIHKDREREVVRLGALCCCCYGTEKVFGGCLMLFLNQISRRKDKLLVSLVCRARAEVNQAERLNLSHDAEFWLPVFLALLRSWGRAL